MNGTIAIDIDARAVLERLSSDEKLILVIEALAERHFRPAGVKDLVEATGLAAATVITKLGALQANDWAEKVDDRYRLGKGILDIAFCVYRGAADAALKIADEIKQYGGIGNGK
ncbi:MAG: hypothetical protein HZB29_09910 [Nitrospinae bacterium]|nr:hypothetical protein [Nitrospinota bacterium]